MTDGPPSASNSPDPVGSTEPTDRALDLRAEALREGGVVGDVDLSRPNLDLTRLIRAVSGGVVEDPNGKIEEVDLRDRTGSDNKYRE